MHLRTLSPPTLPAEDLSQLALDNSYKTVILANSRIFNGLESWKTDEYVESLLYYYQCVTLIRLKLFRAIQGHELYIWHCHVL